MRFLIFIVLIGGTLWLIRQGLRDARRGKTADSGSGGGDSTNDSTHLVQDSICKAYIPKDDAVLVAVGKETHYFCSDRCASVYRDEHS